VMKVAVAGTAGLARSIGTAILEEKRHEVVILSRYVYAPSISVFCLNSGVNNLGRNGQIW
jgi:hypothetical protein